MRFYRLILSGILSPAARLIFMVLLRRRRLRPGGGSAGQKGIASIIERLGTQDFPRLRVGIGRPPGRMDAADYVLQDFSTGEKELLQGTLDRAAEAALVFVNSDLNAIAAIEVIRRHGKRIPDEIAVVGYDDLSIASYYQPSLTTIRQWRLEVEAGRCGARSGQARAAGTTAIPSDRSCLRRELPGAADGALPADRGSPLEPGTCALACHAGPCQPRPGLLGVSNRPR